VIRTLLLPLVLPLFVLVSCTDVDRCLDAGGSYDYIKQRCDHKNNHPSPMAIDDLKRDAERGLTPSQILLAFYYMEGEGVEKDYVQAHRWLSAAHSKGASRATYLLAVLYRDGLGTEKSETEAEKLFIEAANRDEFLAKIELGRLYAKRKDNASADRARHWYAEAVSQASDVNAPDEVKEARTYLSIKSNARDRQ
jgi:TPR repeat protein